MRGHSIVSSRRVTVRMSHAQGYMYSRDTFPQAAHEHWRVGAASAERSVMHIVGDRVVLRSGREPPVSVKKCRVFGGSSGLRVFAFQKR